MTKSIVKAIEDFSDWSKPWTFLASVLANEELSVTDQQLVRAVWSEACCSEHWCAGELSRGSEIADRVLARSYTWLSTSARAQVVRAASYQWR